MFAPPIVGYVILLITSTVLACASSRGKLPRNSAVGIRTRRTLHSDEAWRAAQRSAVPYLVAIAIIAVAHAAALLTVELTVLTATLGHILAVSGFLVIIAVAILALNSANAAAQRAASRRQ